LRSVVEVTMRSWSAGVLGALVVMLAMPVMALAEETPVDTASFRVETTNLELGKVKAGEVAEATFVFHNDGKEPVKIIRAKPS
jgi:hypothetical protein